MLTDVLLSEENSQDRETELRLLDRMGFASRVVEPPELHTAAVQTSARMVVMGIEEDRGRLQHLAALRLDPQTRHVSTVVLVPREPAFYFGDDIVAVGPNALVSKPFSPHRLEWELGRLTRIEPRECMELGIQVRRGGAADIATTSLNVSASGVLLRGPEDLHLSGRVSLQIAPRVTLEAVVVRTAAERGVGHIALRFLAGPGVVAEDLRSANVSVGRSPG